VLADPLPVHLHGHGGTDVLQSYLAVRVQFVGQFRQLHVGFHHSLQVHDWRSLELDNARTSHAHAAGHLGLSAGRWHPLHGQRRVARGVGC